MMRNLFLAAVAAGSVASIGMTSSPVQARDYPFCIKGADYDSAVGDCSFDTYEQCLATASGRKAYCDANPFFAYSKKQQFDYPKKPRRQY
jgi:Protein of unknown function (DUF3551)